MNYTTNKTSWACDFETLVHPQKTYVWCWGACEIDGDCDNFIHGQNINQFMLWAFKQHKLFFHNLKFDGGFIVDWLFRNGFTHTTGKKIGFEQFKTVISKSGQWYKISIRTENHVLHIWDSLKKLPFSIARLAKAFKLDQIKGEIDYIGYRSENHEITPDELEYLKTDCVILAKSLKIQLDQGLTKMTIGSDAMNYYKLLMGKYFRYYFPHLPDDIDDEIRKAYKGGYTYLHQAGEHFKTCCFDVNSLYPYAMTLPLPYGWPVYFDGEYRQNEKYPLYIMHFSADFKLKPGYIPTIQLKNGSPWHNAVEYVTDSHGKQEMTLTSVDYEIFLEHYDVFEIDFINGYMFKSRTGLFNDYINKWMEIKEMSSGAVRELAKLMLNNLYGKFCKNKDVTGKIPVFENGRVVLKMDEYAETETVYIPVGAFITANARKITIDAAQANIDRFVYADTDSITLTGHEQPIGIEIHETALGAWKHEYNSYRSRFIRPKRYCCFIGKQTASGGMHYKLQVKCAGMPDNCKKQINWNNFKLGTVVHGKLSPVSIHGGVYLKETTFTLD